MEKHTIPCAQAENSKYYYCYGLNQCPSKAIAHQVMNRNKILEVYESHNCIFHDLLEERLQVR